MDSKNQKPELLREIADRTELVKVQVPISAEEKETLNKEFLDQSFEHATLEEELREVSSGYKAKIKEIKKANRERMRDLRLGYRETDESCFLVSDQDEDVMKYYTSEGVFVHERPLHPHERQPKMFNLNKEVS